MALELEIASLVRLRNRKFADIRSGQPDRPGEGHVTGGAGAVRGVNVGRPNPMAIEAVPRHRKPDLHAIGAWLCMA